MFSITSINPFTSDIFQKPFQNKVYSEHISFLLLSNQASSVCFGTISLEEQAILTIPYAESILSLKGNFSLHNKSKARIFFCQPGVITFFISEAEKPTAHKGRHNKETQVGKKVRKIISKGLGWAGPMRSERAQQRMVRGRAAGTKNWYGKNWRSRPLQSLAKATVCGDHKLKMPVLKWR